MLVSLKQRARETCELAGLGEAAVVEPDLVEWDYGEYEGLTLKQIREAARTGCGIRELLAEVLSDNTTMLKVFEKSGFDLRTKRDSGVVHVTLRLT